MFSPTDSVISPCDFCVDDRLIGVNGFYVDTKPHNEVVRLIRSGGSSTWLLVVDRETDEYFFKVAKRKPNFSDAVYGQEGWQQTKTKCFYDST